MNTLSKEEIALKNTSGIFDEYELGITGLSNAMDEYAELKSIEFLDSIREYIRESHCDIVHDERTSEDFYKIFNQSK